MLAQFLHVSNITSCSSQDSSYVLDLKSSDILGLCSLNSGFQTKDKRKEPRGVCALSTHTDPLPRALRLYHHKHVHTSAVSSIMETDLLIFHRRTQLKEKHTWFSSLTARPSELKTQLTRSLSTEAAVDPLCGCPTNGRQKHRNTQSESLRSFQSKHQTANPSYTSLQLKQPHTLWLTCFTGAAAGPPAGSFSLSGVRGKVFFPPLSFLPFLLFPFFFLCFPVFSRAESFQTPNQQIQNAPRTRKSLQSLESEREGDAEREAGRARGDSLSWPGLPGEGARRRFSWGKTQARAFTSAQAGIYTINLPPKPSK